MMKRYKVIFIISSVVYLLVLAFMSYQWLTKDYQIYQLKQANFYYKTAADEHYNAWKRCMEHNKALPTPKAEWGL